MGERMRKQVLIKSKEKSGYRQAFDNLDENEVTGLLDLLQFRIINVTEDHKRVFVWIDEQNEEELDQEVKE